MDTQRATAGKPVRKRLVCLLLILLGTTLPVAAPGVTLMACSPDNPYDPYIFDTGGTVVVQIVVAWAASFNTVVFALDLPECDGLTLVDVSYGNNLAVGSLETGVLVTFVGCKTNFPYVVATLTFQSTGIHECCYLRFHPHPDSQSGQVEGFDCSSQLVTVYATNAVIAPAGSETTCGAPLILGNPSPPNGSVAQPLSAELSWDWDHSPLFGPSGGEGFTLRFGTDPKPPFYAWYVFPPQQVGPLQPNTTYYWRIQSWIDAVAYADGPVWSFTTTDGVGVATSTWGRIKALYQ